MSGAVIDSERVNSIPIFFSFCISIRVNKNNSGQSWTLLVLKRNKEKYSGCCCEVIPVKLTLSLPLSLSLCRRYTQAGAVLVLSDTTNPHYQFLPVTKDGLPKTIPFTDTGWTVGRIPVTKHDSNPFHNDREVSVPWPSKHVSIDKTDRICGIGRPFGQ